MDPRRHPEKDEVQEAHLKSKVVFDEFSSLMAVGHHLNMLIKFFLFRVYELRLFLGAMLSTHSSLPKPRSTKVNHLKHHLTEVKKIKRGRKLQGKIPPIIWT